MIVLFKGDEKKLTTNGLMVLDRYITLANITDEVNGEYSLEVHMTFDERLNCVENGMLLRAPAPIRETPEINLYTQTGYDVYVVSQTDEGKTPMLRAMDDDAEQVAELAQGTQVIVNTPIESGWYRVIAPTGAAGYMKSGAITYARTEYNAPIYAGIIKPKQTREQLFRIESHTCELGEMTITAKHIFYDLEGNYITGADVGPAGASTHFERIKTHMLFPSKFRLYGGATGTGSLDLNRKNPADAILGGEGVVETCGGEVLRDNYEVFYADHVGMDRGVSIAYRKNITGMSVKIDDANVATHIIPIGYDADDKAVYLQPMAVAGPNASKYATVKAVEKEYRDVKVGDLYADVAAVRAKLMQLAAEAFAAGADVPEVEADVDFVDLRGSGETGLADTLKNVFVGDTVHLRHESYGFDFAVEVVAGVWDCVASEWVSIELGTKHATLGSIRVDPSLIPDSAISGRKIGVNAVGAENIGAGAVTGGAIAPGAVNAEKIEYGTITADKIKAKEITAEKIAAGAITTEKLDAKAVTATKIDAGAVTADKIDAGAVTADKIDAGAVTAEKIGAGEITADLIAANAVTADKIEAGSITAESGIIAEGAIGTAQIADGSITEAKIVSLTANKITAGTINGAEINVSNLNADNIVAGTINGQRIPVLGSDKIEDGAISGIKIENGAITETKIGDSAVTADKVVAGAVTAEKIAANAVTAEKILAGAVTAGKIDANAVTATNIAAGAVTATKIEAGAITANHIAANTITAAKLASDVGASLDLSSNTAIYNVVKNDGVIGAINNTGEEVAISASKINLNGAVTANSFFKIGTDGSMEAISGKIGGWIIQEGQLYANTWESGNQIGMSSDNKNYSFWAGNGKFRVAQDGYLYATNAKIEGEIKATSGSIGGWTILAESMLGGDISLGLKTGISTHPQYPAFWAGQSESGIKFYVLQNGTLYAEGATLKGNFYTGNWAFTSDGMTYTNGGNYIRIIVSGGTAYYESKGYNVVYGSSDYRNTEVRGAKVTLNCVESGQSVSAMYGHYGSYAYDDVCLICDQAGNSYGSAKGNLGTTDNIWDVFWCDTVHYNTRSTSSSRTVKHDIQPIGDVGGIVDGLEPVSFVYNSDESEKKRYGLIYEDTINVFPDICLEEHEGDKTLLGIEYDVLVPILLQAVKELRERVATLEKQGGKTDA